MINMPSAIVLPSHTSSKLPFKMVFEFSDCAAKKLLSVGRFSPSAQGVTDAAAHVSLQTGSRTKSVNFVPSGFICGDFFPVSFSIVGVIGGLLDFCFSAVSDLLGAHGFDILLIVRRASLLGLFDAIDANDFVFGVSTDFAMRI